ncbi:MAG: M23 family metallopeptidase, partial [Spirochaetia bacterium]|nr:M23 family metallopeptidase [Spirochaetia bacterium]
MNNRLLAKVSLLIIVLFTLSFNWPVENGRLTSTFGESRGDHFHDGIDLVSADDIIRPAADGTVMYFWDKSFFPLDNEPGGGNFTIIQHEGDVCSVYMHIAVGTISASGKQLAVIGNSGHS